MVGGKAGVVVGVVDDLQGHELDPAGSRQTGISVGRHGKDDCAVAGKWGTSALRSSRNQQGSNPLDKDAIPADARSFVVTNRSVLAIAVPMTLAYLTTPMLGLVDTAVVGQFGDAALLGGLAVGALVFDVVFTSFNFLRSGTTGLVAQAFGRGDALEEQAVFWRAVLIARRRRRRAGGAFATDRRRRPVVHGRRTARQRGDGQSISGSGCLPHPSR